MYTWWVRNGLSRREVKQETGAAFIYQKENNIKNNKNK